YFITVQGNGKRIQSSNTPVGTAVTIDHYDFRYFYELDSVNFLSSGKEWFGEEFNDAPGKTTSHQFLVPIQNREISQPVQLVSRLASRSIGSASSFDIRINGQLLQQFSIPPVGAAIN